MMWVRSQPKFINDFIINGEVLGALIQRVKTLEWIQYSKLDSILIRMRGTTLLHKLSQYPLNDDQMTSIMDILQEEGIRPEAKDRNGYTFLELSPVEERLSIKIYAAPDAWTSVLWTRMHALEKWIALKNDRLLMDIFRRMSIYMSSNSFQNSETIEPFCLARAVWRDRANLPEAFNEFIYLTAKYHENDEGKLKRLSKEHLSSGSLDIALPFFQTLKPFTVKHPSFGYYVKQLFATFMGLSLLLRSIDAITDIALTMTFFQNWTKVLNDFHQLASFNNTEGRNITYFKDKCRTEASIACSITNIDGGWIPGVVSLLVLLVSYLAEIFTTTLNFRNKGE